MAGDGNYGGNGSVYTETTLPDGQVLSGHDEAATTAGNLFMVNLSYCISPVGEGAPADALTGDALRQAKRSRAMQIQSVLDDVVSQAQRAKGALDASVDNPDNGPLVVTLHVPIPMVTRAGKPTGSPADPWEVNVHWDGTADSTGA